MNLSIFVRGERFNAECINKLHEVENETLILAHLEDKKREMLKYSKEAFNVLGQIGDMATHDYFDGFKKDREALASDWGKIGGDFRRAIDQYVETHEGKANPVN